MPETDVPEVALPIAIFSMCLIGLLAFSVRYWFQAVMLWMAGQAVLPKIEPHPIQRWGFVDLVFTFFLVLILQAVALFSGVLLGLGPRPGPDDEVGLTMLTWISTVQTLGAFIVTAFIALRCHVKAGSIGWSLARLTYDIRLGVKTFVMIAPPVYLLMIGVTLLSGKEYKHPIHEMASEDPWLLVPAMLMAVVLAPLSEEFAFRVLLQGFLESLSIGRFSIEKFFVGRVRDSAPMVVELVEPYDAPPQVITSREMSPFDEGIVTEDSCVKLEHPTETSRPWWPIIVSGVLFGLAHLEYGMSWIPLVVLGIVLGWLYRVTNRIWPSLVVHFCVNATSMVGFALTVFFGDPTEPIP